MTSLALCSNTRVEISHLTARYVYYARVTQLNPSETYYFVVGDEGYHKTYSKVKKIRMAPEDDSSFSFAVGGDVVSRILLYTSNTKRDWLQMYRRC